MFKAIPREVVDTFLFVIYVFGGLSFANVFDILRWMWYDLYGEDDVLCRLSWICGMVMELSDEQRGRIEEIAEGLKCSKSFRCAELGFDALCEAVDIGFESLLVCSDDNKGPCGFKVYIGDFSFCTCPLRSYIAKNLNK